MKTCYIITLFNKYFTADSSSDFSSDSTDSETDNKKNNTKKEEEKESNRYVLIHSDFLINLLV